jgi:NADP-dependent 3-hydroxy acid dehydrogenase YdfG
MDHLLSLPIQIDILVNNAGLALGLTGPQDHDMEVLLLLSLP